MDVTSRLIVHPASSKLRADRIAGAIAAIRSACGESIRKAAVA
jgi:hypothetical protein